MIRAFRRRRAVVGALVISSAVLAAVALHAQQRFQLFLLAFDNDGLAVTDLKASDLQYRENDAAGSIVSVERFRWPLKLTVLVDNGAGGAAGIGGRVDARNCGFDNLVHYRNGLKKLFESLPTDLEVSLVATAPSPRHLVRNTADQVQLQKAVNLLVPDSEFPGRFTDSLTEYAQRLDLEFKNLSREERLPYVPVLIAIGSTSLDGSRIERDRVERMMLSLRSYGVWTNFVMVSPCAMGDGLNEGGTVLIAKAVQEFTGGRYESIASAATTRLATLLPEIGEKIGARHQKQMLQYRVTIERPEGATGQPLNSAISLSRLGIKYIMSADGSYP